MELSPKILYKRINKTTILKRNQVAPNSSVASHNRRVTSTRKSNTILENFLKINLNTVKNKQSTIDQMESQIQLFINISLDYIIK